MTQDQFHLFNTLFNEAYSWYTGQFGMCVNRADVERLYDKVYKKMTDCNVQHTQQTVVDMYTLWNMIGQLTARTTLDTVYASKNPIYAPTRKDDDELYQRMINDPVSVRQDIIRTLQVLHG